MLSSVYRRGGHGLERYYAKAVEYYVMPSDHRCPIQAYTWVSFLKRDGCGKLLEKVVDIYQKAANSGFRHFGSWHQCIYMEEMEEPLSRSMRRPHRWYKRGARLGSREHFERFGKVFENGEGVELSQARALQIFESPVRRVWAGRSTG